MQNTTFTSFCLLPLEIRMQIWTLAIPKSRVIQLYASFGQLSYVPLSDFKATLRHMDFTLRIPSILHVNRESRRCGLEIFQYGFNTLASTTGRRSYWNPSRDTLYLTFLPQYFDFVNGKRSNDQIYERDRAFDMRAGLGLLHASLANIRHLALPWDKETIIGLKPAKDRPVSPEFFDTDDEYLKCTSPDGWLLTFLSGFKRLQSLSFLIDHKRLYGWAGDLEMRADVVLYECEDVPVITMGLSPWVKSMRLVPSEVEQRIEHILEEYMDKELSLGHGHAWAGTVPDVDLLVTGYKKRKPSGFCLPVRH